MNLIAKEAPLVNARDGVLVLSETVGAHDELGQFAVSVNPFDIQGQADALAEALEMPLAERSAPGGAHSGRTCGSTTSARGSPASSPISTRWTRARERAAR